MYFWNLWLLSPWFDEADELLFLHGSLANSINIPASGGHPPLYFAVIYYWMRLPLGLDWAVQGRTLSVIFALAATVAADRLWARELSTHWRWAFLSLWTLSPFLLLYSRMSRSYSLQLLVGTVIGGLLVRFLAGKTCPTWALAGWLAVAVYVHPVPGFALVAAANVLFIHRRQLKHLALIDAIVAVAYLPWIFRLLSFLPTWGVRGGNLYELTGRIWIEIPVKLAYWAFSFTLGEAVPDAALLCGILLGLGAAILLVTGALLRRDLIWIGLPAAAIGFVGVARWNSYPFVPARMIFLFPVFLMLLVAGAQAHRRIGLPILAGMLALSLSGIWCYFHLAGFRNKQYPMPESAIAAQIRRESAPGAYAVLVDSTNADPIGLAYQLGPVLETGAPSTAAAIDQIIRDPKVRTIWFLRSTHDVSPTELDSQFERILSPGMRESVYPIESLTPLEMKVAEAAGVRDPPRYFQELLKFEKTEAPQ